MIIHSKDLPDPPREGDGLREDGCEDEEVREIAGEVGDGEGGVNERIINRNLLGMVGEGRGWERL